MELIIPKDYDPRLSIRETQDAIKYIRDTFQKEMGREMHLERISAPICGAGYSDGAAFQSLVEQRDQIFFVTVER